jgi:hypothetical protein
MYYLCFSYNTKLTSVRRCISFLFVQWEIVTYALKMNYLKNHAIKSLNLYHIKTLNEIPNILTISLYGARGRNRTGTGYSPEGF